MDQLRMIHKLKSIPAFEIDAVYIATPVFCHKDQVIKSADAKKHILLEKPMGLSVKHLRVF